MNLKKEFLDIPRLFKRDNLILMQSTIFGSYLVLLWLIQYWNQPGNPNLIGRISFQVADKPWVPNGQTAETVLGLHYFGDWVLSVAWALNENCYQLGQYSCQQPPLGIWILRAWNFVFLDMKIGYFFWVCIAAVIYMFLVKKLLKSLTLISKFIVFFIFVLSAPGNLISLDRGSLHFMTFALLGLSYYLDKNGNQRWSLVFLTFAIALKPQVLLATLILIYYRRFKHLAIIFLTTGILNCLLLLSFSGDPRSNLLGYVKASLGYVNSEASFGNIMNSVSLVGVISRLIESKTGWGGTLTYLTQYGEFLMFPGIVWLLFVIFLITRNKVSAFTAYALVLSLTSLVVPASSPYTLGWATLAMLIFFQDENKEFELRKSQQLQLFMLMIVTITPGFILYNGIPGFSRHIPLIVLLPIVLSWTYFSEFLKLHIEKAKLKGSESI